MIITNLKKNSVLPEKTIYLILLKKEKHFTDLIIQDKNVQLKHNKVNTTELALSLFLLKY